MDLATAILLALAVALAVLAVLLWLAWNRARARGIEMAAQLADAQTRAGEAQARLAPASERVQELTAELARVSDAFRTERQAATAQATDLRVELARLTESQRAAEAARRDEREADAKIYAERERALVEKEAALRREIEALQKRAAETFDSLAAKALKDSTDGFLKLATQRLATAQQQSEAALDQRKAAVEGLIKPIGEALQRQEQKLADISRQWGESRAGLVEGLRSVGEAQSALRTETGRLVRALRDPHVRGHYGEVTLRRVAELSGMSPRCDFSTQESSRDGEGNLLRPDMVVNLPSQRCIAIDAKTNIRAYLEALECDGEQQVACLDRFADHVARQAADLGRKGYWRQYDGAPEFTVMFIPGEQFIDAALQRRPTLLEDAARHNVVIAGPATLIALLRAVAVGWNEHKLAEEAKALMKLGRELHERAAIVLDHAARLGKAVNTVVGSYNDFAGSLEKRLLPTIRKFEESGAGSGREIADAVLVESSARLLEAAAATEKQA
jgi:DNA recombination protein RmuC